MSFIFTNNNLHIYKNICTNYGTFIWIPNTNSGVRAVRCQKSPQTRNSTLVPFSSTVFPQRRENHDMGNLKLLAVVLVRVETLVWWCCLSICGMEWSQIYPTYIKPTSYIPASLCGNCSWVWHAFKWPVQFHTHPLPVTSDTLENLELPITLVLDHPAILYSVGLAAVVNF